MSELNIVQKAFDQFGRQASMQKKAGSWYRTGTEVIAVSNLQKSQYGPLYYFNQGFWFRRFGEDRYPKYYQCHVVDRLEGLLPEREREVAELFDLDRTIADDARSAAILRLLNDGLLPIIAQASTVAGMKHLRDEGVFEGAGLKAEALEAFLEP